MVLNGGGRILRLRYYKVFVLYVVRLKRIIVNVKLFIGKLSKF